MVEQFVMLLIGSPEASDLGWKLISALGVIMLGTIAYFLKDLHQGIKDLRAVIINMQISAAAQVEASKAFAENCRNVCENTKQRLDKHGRIIDSHEVEIQVIKERIKSK